MSPDVLFPLAFMIVACVIVPTALYYRHKAAETRHRRFIEALMRGVELRQPWWSGYLFRGLLWLLTGIGVSIFFIAMYRVEGDLGLLAMATLGSIPAGIGVAHLVVHRLQPKPPQ